MKEAHRLKACATNLFWCLRRSLERLRRVEGIMVSGTVESHRPTAPPKWRSEDFQGFWYPFHGTAAYWRHAVALKTHRLKACATNLLWCLGRSSERLRRVERSLVSDIRLADGENFIDAFFEEL